MTYRYSALEVEKKCNNKCSVCCYRYDLRVFEFFLYLSKVFGAIYYRKIKKSDFIFWSIYIAVYKNCTILQLWMHCKVIVYWVVFIFQSLKYSWLVFFIGFKIQKKDYSVNNFCFWILTFAPPLTVPPSLLGFVLRASVWT